jgi:hypothetical protein
MRRSVPVSRPRGFTGAQPLVGLTPAQNAETHSVSSYSHSETLKGESKACLA